MIKRELTEGIIQYMFEPAPGKHFGFNILAIINGNKAILIDTAYEAQAQQVLEDLNSNGLTLERIIISHFHGDHIYGLKVLPKVPVYGSIHFQQALDLWEAPQDHAFFTPTVLIDRPHLTGFGKHQLTLIPFPGHAQCGILVNLNNTYIHVGDELMFSNEGQPLLPSIDYASVKRHIDSLNKLKEYSQYTFIPSHGSIIKGKEKVEADIDNRLLYLNAILSHHEKITYEEAVKDCNCTFLHSGWHDHVYA